MTDLNHSTAQQPVRMCADCQVISTTPILVNYVEQASGPGWNLYACPDCAPHRLTHAKAWQLYIEHAASCPVCSTPGHQQCNLGKALAQVHKATRTPKPVKGS
ncbi:hypothetical protein NJL88_11515 [Streptomyces sp. DK15]|uniref:hypothetical protein n=1 Tax=Streptomyces sp. DK15 TaxID=2957499 RepID=UPI0029BD7702|nr:hypothetical protein [Streptomyces sp. DK15]MDX2390681.1 hypothetical protein [Streptomyces sp. DK15]